MPLLSTLNNIFHDLSDSFSWPGATLLSSPSSPEWPLAQRNSPYGPLKAIITTSTFYPTINLSPIAVYDADGIWLMPPGGTLRDQKNLGDPIHLIRFEAPLLRPICIGELLDVVETVMKAVDGCLLKGMKCDAHYPVNMFFEKLVGRGYVAANHADVDKFLLVPAI